MAILVFQHHPAEPAAELGVALSDHGHRLRVIQLFAGQPLPADLDNVDGIVSMGGPMNVTDAGQHPWMEGEMALLRAAHEASIPVVGICLGCQLLAAALGGEVGPMEAGREVGWEPIQLGFPGTIDPIYSGLPWKQMQFHSHGQEVRKLPPGATPLAGSKVSKIQAWKSGYRTYGFQYHFEWDRQGIAAQLDFLGAEANAGGSDGDADLGAIRDAVDEHYDLYRHLGDRLCGNLVTLLFAIDKRLGHHATIEPRANFHAAQS